MIRYIMCLFLALSLTGQAFAQSRKSKAKVAKTAEEILYDELLLSTAKVMFIDSLVVDKDSFLLYIPLPKDGGTLTRKDGQAEYTNEFADTRLFTANDTVSGQHLYISHRYGKEWEAPRQLAELDNETPDYPFLMADGVTLYFSAEGEGTVGGRDIFRTLYNADDLEFYEATNVGLPFNSPANDYLLAISDIDNLGWLVTDRNQEEGKVCIYTFEPPAQRVAFDEDTPTAELKRYAEIRQISDTQIFGDAEAALKRQSNLIDRLDEKEDNAKIEFVVNDLKIYTSLADFSSDANRKQYKDIQEAYKKLEMLGTLVSSMRESYSSASSSKRYEMGRKIAELEAETEELAEKTRQAEKELRNKENK